MLCEEMLKVKEVNIEEIRSEAAALDIGSSGLLYLLAHIILPSFAHSSNAAWASTPASLLDPWSGSQQGSMYPRPVQISMCVPWPWCMV